MRTAVVIIFHVMCLLLTGSISEAQQSIDLTLQTRAVQLQQKCSSTSGLMVCKNCRTLVQCVKFNETDYQEVELLNCSSTQSCSYGACSNEPCAVSNDVKFQCLSTGIFPDPFDCKKYYLCPASLVAETHNCDEEGLGYGFNPKTLLCSTKLTNKKCSTSPIPPCTFVGQTGPIPNNPSYFYICGMKDGMMYPYQQICSYDKVYQTGKGCSGV